MVNISETSDNDLNFEFKKEIISDKNNKFLIFFKIENDSELKITAVNDNLVKNIFSNKFTIELIQKNKYFCQFDNLKEICEEFLERIEKDKMFLIEETNSLIISIPLPSSKIKDFIFILNKEEKTDNEIIQDLIKIIVEQKNEITKLKNELNDFKTEMSFLCKNYITNLDSIIINNNLENSMLKNWINPKKKIKANLLYRLTRDGSEISTFHSLCDNKGATLTLMNIKINEHKIGFFINKSFDCYSGWKKDDDSFLFNLNQNKKYKKILSNSNAFYCGQNCGPSVNGLGCDENEYLNFIFHSKGIEIVFEEGNKILSSKDYFGKNKEVKYEINEMEIFQIIID